MKILIGILLLVSFSCFGVTIEFVGPCDGRPFFSKNISAARVPSVGALTIDVLEKFEIAYSGTENGLNQVLNSPIGLDAMEVISDNEMMAYGWCYEVDGKLSEQYPNEVSLNQVKHVKWFYGYAHYRNGTWVSQCLKSYLRKSPFICQKRG